ncbi:MAG: hypothetical protein ACI8RZ_002757 [Myxococcota bacterium]|jgi:hypothetical protein
MWFWLLLACGEKGETPDTSAEVCDGADNDGDGMVDEGVTTTFYADADADGFGDINSTTESCEAPDGYVTLSGDSTTDCDDADTAINPDAEELCDDLDNDCDGDIDEDVLEIWYADADGDGYGNNSSSTEACDLPGGYVADDTDCDDADSAVNPAATEVCNEIDDDCNSLIDDDDSNLDSSTGTVWYADNDGDTYGDSSASTETCDLPSGYVVDDTDCDDADSAVNPAATEICNEIDDDCDALIDDDDSNLDSSAGTVWYADTDGDAYGNSGSTTETCDLPDGYVADDTDCDDADSAVNPAATEVCNEIDDDCDALIDDDDSNLDSSTGTVWYADSDGDGYGSSFSSVETCDMPGSYVADDTDCDDSAATTFPGAEETCDDGIDSDCDGLVDCEDGDCFSEFLCDEDCSDGGDNDNDGLTDCDDDDCIWVDGCLHPAGVKAQVQSGILDLYFQQDESSLGHVNNRYTATAWSVSGTVRLLPIGVSSWSTATASTACTWQVATMQHSGRNLFGTYTWATNNRSGFAISSACPLQTSGFLPTLFPGKRGLWLPGGCWNARDCFSVYDIWYGGSTISSHSNITAFGPSSSSSRYETGTWYGVINLSPQDSYHAD